MRRGLVLISLGLVSACAVMPETDVLAPPEVVASELVAAAPPPDARSVEEFDTTTQDQRAAAAAPSSKGVLLGQAVLTLGDPGRAGFWVETALVEVETTGRVALKNDGKSVEVVLLPGDGSGRISLAALRVLEMPLTALVEVNIYENQ